jgi:NAD(P)-dependent dehydrogenase (short-subunit alcohol dehydrogenase family)
MKDFKGKVAVITGAASGIGRGLAERSVTEGMKVVITDVMQEALSKAEEELKDMGGDVLAVQTDVSKAEAVQRLADVTLDT